MLEEMDVKKKEKEEKGQKKMSEMQRSPKG